MLHLDNRTMWMELDPALAGSRERIRLRDGGGARAQRSHAGARRRSIYGTLSSPREVRKIRLR